MCGILGSVNQEIDNNLLDLIKHRGPDDFGIQQFNFNTSNQLKWIFGEKCLKIFDTVSRSF